MATRDRHYLEIVIDSSKARRQMRNIDKNLGLLRRSAQGVEKAFRRLNSVFALALGGTVIANAIRGITQTLDTFNELQSRVSLVAAETVGLNNAMDDLTRLALETSTSLESTATLYTRLGVATKDLGLGHRELLDISEAVALSLRLSGASSKESAAFMTQFSQAMASGRFQGDEFRAMLESNVVLSTKLAEALDTNVGGLREMAAAGELTANVVLPKLLEVLKELRLEAEELPTTVSRGLTDLNTGFTLLIGRIDEAAGATTAFGDILSSVGRIMSGLGFLLGAEDGQQELRRVVERQRELVDQLRDIQQRNEGVFEPLSFMSTARQESVKRQIQGIIDEYVELEQVRQRIINQPFDESLFPGQAAESAMGGIIGDIMTGRPSPDEGGRRPRSTIVQQTLAQDSAIWDAWLEQQTKVQQSIDLSTDGFEEHIKKNEELGRATMDLVDPNAALVREMESLDKQLRAGVITADVWLERQLQIAEQMENNLGPAVEDAEKNLDSLSVALGQTMANAVDRLGDTMVDFAFGTKTSFSDMANSILKDIASMMVKFALMRIMFGGQTPGAAGNQGGLLSFLFNAKGNAFSGGNVVPFAKGGIVNRPTVFPMANGGVGMMGERGAEAVMPLMRDSKGRLGVSGGGTVINIHNNTSGEVEQNITNGPDGSEIVDIVIGQVDARIMAGGTTARALETAYGVKRAGYNR